MKRKKRQFLGLNLGDRRTLAAIRIAGYSVLLLAAAVIAAVLVATARGYDIDRETGEVIRNGLILVDASPQDADIYINDVFENDETPGRLPLPEGTYTLSLQREGYQDWTKKIKLTGSEVRWIYYPILAPVELKPTLISSFDSVDQTLQSDDQRRLAVVADAKRPQIRLFDLENILNPATTVTIPTAARANVSAGDKVQYEIIEWSDSDQHVLVKQTVAGEAEYIVVDVLRPQDSVNASKVASLELSEVHFVPGSSDQLYGIADGDLREVKLNDKTVSAPLLQGVEYYSLGSEGQILFVAEDDDKQLNAGILNGETPQIITSVTNKATQYQLLYDDYDGEQYFVVATDSSEVVEIYHQPEEVEPDTRQKVFTTIETKAPPQSISFSQTKQFLVVHSGNSFKTYDFEEKLAYSFGLGANFNSKSELAWIDGHRFVIADAKGNLLSAEYDGANKYKLGKTTPGFSPALTRSLERMYSLQKSPSNDKILLQETRLIVEN